MQMFRPLFSYILPDLIFFFFPPQHFPPSNSAAPTPTILQLCQGDKSRSIKTKCLLHSCSQHKVVVVLLQQEITVVTVRWDTCTATHVLLHHGKQYPHSSWELAPSNIAPATLEWSAGFKLKFLLCFHEDYN